ncbi:MAG: hypothetical protein V3W04_02710 [Gammaproteobacteria bacterium]
MPLFNIADEYRRPGKWCIYALFPWLVSCAQLDHSFLHLPSSTNTHGYSSDWVDDLYRANRLSAEDYRDVLKAREIEFSQQATYSSRIRLVLLLSRGQSAFREPGRALKILDGQDVSELRQGQRAFYDLVLQVVEEQGGQSRKVSGKSIKKVRVRRVKRRKSSPARKKSVEPVSASAGEFEVQPVDEREQAYLKELSQAKRRIKELEQQLHELTSIEKSIQEREATSLSTEQKK